MITGFFLFAVALPGCTKYETSELLEEPGMVINKWHVPAHTTISLEYNIFSEEFELTPHNIPNEWFVEFSCQHGKFTISGGEQSAAVKCFHKLSVGREVWIYYKEIFRVNEKENGDVEKVHYDFNFVDAAHERRSPEYRTAYGPDGEKL